MRTLGDITASRIDQEGPPDDGAFVYVDISSIDTICKRIVAAKQLDAEQAPSRARQRLKFGDVLVSMTRPNRNAVAIVPNELDGAIGSTGFHVLRPRSGISHRWLHYAVQTNHFVGSMSGLVQGALYPAVRPKDIRSYALEVPDSLDQERIADDLDMQFSRLDEAVASLKRAQANLKRYKAAVLKAAVEGKLTEQWRKDHPVRNVEAACPPCRSGVPPLEDKQRQDAAATVEPASELLKLILAERRQKWTGRGKYKEIVAPDTANLPPLPVGWVWANIEQLSASEQNSITDGPFGSNLKTEHYTESGPRVIRLQNIGDGDFIDVESHIGQERFERLQKHCAFPNDLVIAAFGDKPPRSCMIPEALGPAIVKADCIRFKPHQAIAAKYMNIVLNSEPVRKRTKGLVHGVGRPRLNLGEIRSIVISLPPFVEQERIVAEVDQRLSEVEELEAVVSTNLQRTANLRQCILRDAFQLQSGKKSLQGKE